MNYQLYKLGSQQRGSTVEVTLKGSAANVRLLNSHNLSLYKKGRQHKFYGGLARKSPVHLQIPQSGQWYVVIDMQGLRGTTRSSVRMLPGPLPPIRHRKSDLSSLVRDISSPPSIGSTKTSYDVFVSHASEDKDVVRELVLALQNHGLSVWFDEISMQIGDSLRRSIDQGLARSRFGIVVLSPSFIKKPWTNYEFDGIVTNSISGKQKMLPIWHQISKDQLLEFSPSLVDKIARSTDQFSIDSIAEEIAGVVLNTVTG